MQSETALPAIFNISHFSWIKVLYTDVFLDKTSFLFMQVDECITKYSKIAYFSLYLGLLGFRIIMRKQGVEQLVDIGVSLSGFFLG